MSFIINLPQRLEVTKYCIATLCLGGIKQNIMKSIKYILVAIIVAFTAQLNAQKAVQTASFKVWGNCESCKARIEKAAKSAGVTTASWSESTKMLKITFDGSKTNVDKVSKAVAAVGHDTEKYKADPKVYNALPGCCKYPRGK